MSNSVHFYTTPVVSSLFMAEFNSSSSLVSVNSPRTFPFFKCTFLDKDTGIYFMTFDFIRECSYYSDLDDMPKWKNEIGILLSYWLQQRANHDDIFGRYI